MKTAKHCRVCGKELPTRRGTVCGRVQSKASHCQRTLQSIKSREYWATTHECRSGPAVSAELQANQEKE
jgi:hypothetical protein